jgi:hypothetical protein
MKVSTVKIFHTDTTNKYYISSVELICSTGSGFWLLVYRYEGHLTRVDRWCTGDRCHLTVGGGG